MQYIELDITLEKVVPFGDILISRLNEIKFEGYQEYSSGVKAYVKRKLFNEILLEKVLSDLRSYTALSYTTKVLEEKNWNEEWEKNFSPVFINKECVVRASFHASLSNVRHEIIITPKMSFGTGHHETTFLMMQKMFDLNFSNHTVLDMGCGTGILSILASKLGASYIEAIDVDQYSYENIKENISLNETLNIYPFHGDVSLLGQKKFNIILANINKNVLLQDISDYIRVLKEEGDILLSGFYDEDVRVLATKLESLDLSLVNSDYRNNWSVLHFRK